MRVFQFMKLLGAIICIPGLLLAQKTGIKFIQGLTWQQVVANAKAENKYIFVDCYTTWCGPCKAMDKEVLSNDTISTFINTNFIAVKVQMDKTANDNALIRQWYRDAEGINKRYKIRAYPTYLFFAPDGKLVDKKTGYRTSADFLSLITAARSLKEDYTDPYATYDSLVISYQKGLKNFEKMPYMIKTASELNDTTLIAGLIREYYHYLLSLKEKQLYTNDNLDFLSRVISSRSKLFPIFMKSGEKVDSVMGKKGYAKEVVYQVIQAEDIFPFLEKASQTNTSPNWEQLGQQVEVKFDSAYADWAELDAKVKWYDRRNDSAYITAFITQVEKYGTDTTNAVMDAHLNNLSWIVFKKSNNIEQLYTALRWMEGVLRRKCCNPMGFVWDTYANLLYKVGRKKDAIYWEEKAIENVTGASPTQLVQNYQESLNKMKKGQPTWEIDLKKQR